MKYSKWVFSVLVVIFVLVIGAIVGLRFFHKSAPTVKPSSPVQSQIQIDDKIGENIQTSYYEISGQTKEELRQQMSQLGPECDDGEKCAAYTQWAVDWTSPISMAQSCETVSVITDISVVLPQWTDYEKASPSLQRDWDQYFQKLKTHEEHHQEIVTNCAQKFLDGIKQISGPFESCNEIEDKISDYYATNEIPTQCAQDTETYDLETDHGAKEGVVL